MGQHWKKRDNVDITAATQNFLCTQKFQSNYAAL